MSDPAAIPTSQGESHSLLRFVSNQEMDAEQKANAERDQQEPQVLQLASHLRKLWQAARTAKEVSSSSYKSLQEQLLMSLRQRRGEYDPDKLSAIREQGGSEVFVELTATKCVAAESWIRDILLPTTGERAWNLEPTPIPELNPDFETSIRAEVLMRIEQLPTNEQVGLTPETIASAADTLRTAVKRELHAMAEVSAKKMTTTIEDQLIEGGFYEALNQIITDIVTFKCGILKGPIYRRRRVLGWGRTNGITKPTVETRIRAEWARVSPLDCYPSPNSRGINDGYLFERHKMRRADLIAMKGVPGYSTAAIDLALSQHQLGNLNNWLYLDSERAVAEDRPSELWNSTDPMIEALEFYGSVQGSMLIEWGMSESEITDPLDEYEINAWLIGNNVVRAVINRDPLGRRPYNKASFEEIPGSFWGRGVPEKMRDAQSICNAVARALVNNVGVGSGPQVEVFEDRLSPGESITAIHPFKIWQTKSDPSGSGHRAINFFQPSIIAAELLRVHDYFNRLSDDQTGIPAYVYGNTNVGGGGRTASGLSMLMGAASKGIKQVIVHIDRGIIEPAIEKMYQHNMLFNPDETIKGDLEVNAMGSIALFAKEQNQARLLEFLQITANPIDMQIMGPQGRVALLRGAAEALEIPKGVVPDVDEFKSRVVAEAGRELEQEAATASGSQAPRPRNLDESGQPLADAPRP